MNTKPALVGAAIAIATSTQAGAHAQFEPTVQVCKELAALEVAWQNFETQDVNATLDEVDATAQQISMALDEIAPEARQLSPAAFDLLRDAHQAVEVAIDAVPYEATPEQAQDRIAIAKNNERFAYQNFVGNIVCP